jgi:hypothetical protein
MVDLAYNRTLSGVIPSTVFRSQPNILDAKAWDFGFNYTGLGAGQMTVVLISKSALDALLAKQPKAK